MVAVQGFIGPALPPHWAVPSDSGQALPERSSLSADLQEALVSKLNTGRFARAACLKPAFPLQGPCLQTAQRPCLAGWIVGSTPVLTMSTAYRCAGLEVLALSILNAV